MTIFNPSPFSPQFDCVVDLTLDTDIEVSCDYIVDGIVPISGGYLELTDEDENHCVIEYGSATITPTTISFHIPSGIASWGVSNFYADPAAPILATATVTGTISRTLTSKDWEDVISTISSLHSAKVDKAFGVVDSVITTDSSGDITSETKKTAFNSDIATEVPLMDGVAAVGLSTKIAKEDHVHPSDTSRASLNVVTTSVNGLMSSSDKTKLNGVATGSQVNVLEGIQIDGVDIGITSKKSNVPLATSILDGAMSSEDKVILDAHVANVTTNPHSVTKSNVGLGNCDNTSDANKPVSTAQATAIGLKVDIAQGVDNKDKIVVTHVDTGDIETLAKATAFNKDFETNVVNLKQNGTASLGSLTTLAKSDHVHPKDDSKADLVGGKIPSSQLPASIQSVVNLIALSSTDPILPDEGDAYFNTSAKLIYTYDGSSWGDGVTPVESVIYISLDTNLTYIWSGTDLVEVSASLALGETSGTAYRGDQGKIAYDHTSVTNNPHSVTLSQLSDATGTALNKDFSVTATDIKANGTQALGSLSTLPRADHVHPSDATKLNANLGIATKNVVTDGDGLVTTEDKPTIPIATTSTPVASDGTAGVVGTETAFAKGDHKHPSDASRATTDVATTSVKGLMSATDKTRLDGISAGAQVNVIEEVKVGGTALTPTAKSVDVPKSSSSVLGVVKVDNVTIFADASAVISAKTTVTTDSASTTPAQTLAHNNEYRFTNAAITTIGITAPSGLADDFIASVVWRNPASTATYTLTNNSGLTLKNSGADVSAGTFTPVVSKTYNMIYFNDGVNLNCVIRGV